VSAARHALAACLGVALACTKPEEGARTGPRLAVRWTGADTAAFGAPATAERCDTLHRIEIRAISGDTGVALAVYDSGNVRPGSYPIRPPAAADSAAPAAALAVRWFSRTAVQGFQGDSGQLSLKRAANGNLSGTFTAKAHAISGSGQLALAGSFDDLRVRPAARGCEPPPRDSTASRRDSTAPPRDSTPRVD
jgi:hypothetical protein